MNPVNPSNLTLVSNNSGIQTYSSGFVSRRWAYTDGGSLNGSNLDVPDNSSFIPVGNRLQPGDIIDITHKDVQGGVRSETVAVLEIRSDIVRLATVTAIH